MVVLEDQAGAELARVRASAFFSDALKGVSDPTARRGIISGALFVECSPEICAEARAA